MLLPVNFKSKIENLHLTSKYKIEFFPLVWCREHIYIIVDEKIFFLLKEKIIEM